MGGETPWGRGGCPYQTGGGDPKPAGRTRAEQDIHRDDIVLREAWTSGRSANHPLEFKGVSGIVQEAAEFHDKSH